MNYDIIYCFFYYLFTTKYFFPTALSLALALSLSLSLSLSLPLSISLFLCLFLVKSLSATLIFLDHTHHSFPPIFTFSSSLPFSSPFFLFLLFSPASFSSLLLFYPLSSLPSLPYIYLLIHSLLLSLLFSSLL